MKKILALTIACMMFLTVCAAALAESVDLGALDDSRLLALYEEVKAELGRRALRGGENTETASAPILFRGIPWGTSATEFNATIEALGQYPTLDEYEQPSWEAEIKYSRLMAVDTLNNGGYRCYSFPSGLKVAGINVEFLVAYFMYGYDDEAVYSDPNRSSLYLAEYTLAPSDAEAAFAALQGKLSELYGEGVQTDAGTVWYGPGNTGVRLLIDPHEAGQLILSYGRTNSLELFSDLRAAMAREELEAVLDADGSDGL